MQKKPQTQLTKLFPNFNLTKISDCEKLTIRAKTMIDVWDSKEPTFNAIRRELGALNMKGLIVLEVGRIVLLLKADMDAMQIEHMADHIIKHYPSYTISDLTCFAEYFMTSKSAKSWGKPTIQNVIHEFDNYSTERQEHAVGQRQKEHLDADEIIRQNKQILGTYAKIKAKANEPVKTQKQKDLENLKANAVKIEQLQKEYSGGCMECGGGSWDGNKPCTCQVSHQKIETKNK